MPDDARRALLSHLFDHAPMFPPARMELAAAVEEDRRAQASPHAWLLGRFVVPAGTEVPGRELAEVGGGEERQGDAIYVEGAPLDEIAARGVRAKIRCGGERVPSVEEVAKFIRGCRDRGIVFKATAGLHHAYPTAAREHGFLNVLAAVVFGDEEDALRAAPGAFELDAESFRWGDRAATPAQLADVRHSLFHSIGSCSFFEPVGGLEELGIL
ncbi:MAG TPA: hypothetical protein VMU72_09855 [Gaiellaceae bacterium]|nr:hypothetical protein [Gaiellaceae bacterium]